MIQLPFAWINRVTCHLDNCRSNSIKEQAVGHDSIFFVFLTWTRASRHFKNNVWFCPIFLCETGVSCLAATVHTCLVLVFGSRQKPNCTALFFSLEEWFRNRPQPSTTTARSKRKSFRGKQYFCFTSWSFSVKSVSPEGEIGLKSGSGTLVVVASFLQ